MDVNFNTGEEIVAGIKDVFSVALMIELENEEVLVNKPCTIQSNLTSMLSFGGEVSGMLAIHCPAKVAKSITAAFLGEEKKNLDEEVKDAVGELANMIAGNLKVSYAKHDIDIILALPVSVIGKSFEVTGGLTGANRIIVPLNMDTGKFWVELLYINKMA